MMLSLLSLLLCPLSARAAVPLVPAADVADVDLRAWWRPGELVVGLPEVEGKPALRPLVGLDPTVLPADLATWATVGETCLTDPESRVRIEGERYTALVVGSGQGPVVQLVRRGEVVAMNALGRPARVCEVLVAEADALPGPEVIVAWRLERGTPDAPELRGYTVYRIPEALP